MIPKGFVLTGCPRLATDAGVVLEAEKQPFSHPRAAMRVLRGLPDRPGGVCRGLVRDRLTGLVGEELRCSSPTFLLYERRAADAAKARAGGNGTSKIHTV